MNEEQASENMHVFHVQIEDHGAEEVAFFGYSRMEAKQRLEAWMKDEPFVRAVR